MKRVMLIAYDKKNLGDDLFVHEIVNRYKNVQFYMWTTIESKATFQTLENLTIIDSNSRIFRFLRMIRSSFGARYKEWWEKRCDAVVYIGGSIFIEYENWETILTWWEYVAEHRNFFVLGANFGPYKTDEYRERFAFVFNKMQDVCFRDLYSKRIFNGIPTVRYAPDILFGTKMPERNNFEKRVLISVIDCTRKDEGLNKLERFDISYTHSLVNLIQKAHDDGYKITLTSFCQAEGDEEEIGKILSFFQNDFIKKNVSVLKYSGINKDEMLQGIADADVIVGTRFHSVILGIAAGKHVIPVIYSNKTLNVLLDAGFVGSTADIRQMQENSLVELFDACITQPVQDFSRVVALSKEQFLKLDDFLNNI